MWINLDDKQLDLIESALSYRASEIRTAISVVRETASGPRQRLTEKAERHETLAKKIRDDRTGFDPADPFRAAAKEQANDELEVDDDAIVSESDDGAFVMSWTWITNEEAGFSICEECNGTFTLDRLTDGICDECAAMEAVEGEDNDAEE